MKIGVIYFSKTGNTKAIAESMAKGLNLEATPLSAFAAFDEAYDMIFLGGAFYFGALNKELVAFIGRLDKEKIKNICVFSTNNSAKDACKELKSQVEQKGIHVIDEHFHADGHFLGMKKGHPNEEEKEQAAQFAQNVISLYFPPEPPKTEEGKNQRGEKRRKS